MIGIAPYGIVILLILQNASAQQVTSSAGQSTRPAVNYNPQTGQQINWQPSNAQSTCVSQSTGNSQANAAPDMFSSLQNVKFSFQPVEPPCYDQSSTNIKYQEAKPSFSFQYIPGPAPNQLTSSPQQYVQSQASQAVPPPLYLLQNPIPTAPVPQSNPSQIPIILTMVPQTTAQSTYTPQGKSSSNQPKKTAPLQGNTSENPMAMLMSQLSGSDNPDMSSLLPMLMNTKQEKGGGGMKALLPLIFNLLNNDRGCCTCPNCGCALNDPSVFGGYSNLKNYSQGKTVVTDDSGEVIRVPKKVKVTEVSEEVIEDDEDDDEYEDDEE